MGRYTDLIWTPSGLVTQPVRSEPFIKGPIPLYWIKQAIGKSAPAAKVAWLLWYLSGLTSGYRFSVTNMKADALGISPDTKSRGLRDLEQVGLIRVERQPLKTPVVELVMRAGKHLD